jgi:death-on-curing protein
VVTELFLDVNGYALVANDLDCLTRWLDVASGALTETDMATWLRDNGEPSPTS